MKSRGGPENAKPTFIAVHKHCAGAGRDSRVKRKHFSRGLYPSAMKIMGLRAMGAVVFPIPKVSLGNHGWELGGP